MTQGDAGGGQNVELTRQKTIDALCEHFATDALDVTEFERRVDVAHRAETLAELNGLLADMPSAQVPAKVEAGPAPLARPSAPTLPAERIRDRQIVVGILGGAGRKGSWIPARKNFGIAVCGGVEMDFREARLGPGVTEVTVFAFWGGVDIIVPPDVQIESTGIGIMGGFGQTGHSPASPGPDAPVLKINGLALMGGVEVNVRYPGETPGDARRRRRLARKQQRKRLKDGS